MNDILVTPGEAVTIPECGFTIPGNKLFDHYTDGVNNYDPGDIITLDTDLTLTAVLVAAAVRLT